MKYVFCMVLVLVSFVAFCEDVPPPDQWGHTFSQTLSLTPSQCADLYAMLPESCSNGWARITGKCKINGMETTFVSWARPGKCVAVAVEACTIEVWGK